MQAAPSAASEGLSQWFTVTLFVFSFSLVCCCFLHFCDWCYCFLVGFYYYDSCCKPVLK